MIDAMLSCMTKILKSTSFKAAHKIKPVSFDEKLIKNLLQILEINRDAFFEHLHPYQTFARLSSRSRNRRILKLSTMWEI